MIAGLIGILFIGLPIHGHVNPSLALVRELVRRGHRVTHLLTVRYHGKVEDAGSTLLPHHLDLDIDTIWLSLGSIGTAHKVLGMFRSVHRRAREAIPCFDFVSNDSIFLSGEAPAKSAGMPAACSVTSFAVNEKVVPRRWPTEDWRLRTCEAISSEKA